ncbi:carbohydrate ABC transporter permease [Mahella sp.]|uniref:carbohydrate ABC transporter permease n=1 Tax=Mahella sp. TaxID=2798721 RepID=UPI00344557F7
MMYPVLWLIASSFKDEAEIFQKSYSLIPSSLKFDNYMQGWKGFGGISFGTFFKNSFVIVILSTIGQVASSALVAYGFARIKFVGQRVLFACMIITMLLPSQVLMIPQYILFSRLGWVNSFRPLVVPSYFGYPFFIFLMMQFMEGIPRELDEAARIDGCNQWGIFFRILLPLIRPAMITSAIFSFYWKWQDFFGPLLYLKKPNLYPVSLALKMFSDPAAVTDWGAMFAMSTLSLVPVFIIFVMCQKYIVEGISTTGLKG